jgi:inner membrane protein
MQFDSGSGGEGAKSTPAAPLPGQVSRYSLPVDNLTHTLIGLVAGDSIARSTSASPAGLSAGTRRNCFVVIAAVGGNLPDLDLVVTYGGFTRDKLVYLLQHRGYTHTIAGCVVLALLLYGATELWARSRRIHLIRGDRWALAGMALFGTLLHLGMDTLNSYGVHPFWPFNNEWFYGDSVFIVEPLYWVAAAPMLFLVKSLWARIFVGFALLAALAANVVMHLAQPAWYIAVVLLTIALLVVGKRASARTAALTSAAATVGVTAMFIFAGQAAAHRVEAIAAQDFPSETGIDRVLSPSPTNPLCWDVLLLQSGGGRYIARHAMLANAPSLLAADRCLGVFEGQSTTAPMTAVRAPASRAVRWLGEFSMPDDRLASLVAQDCEAYELMQFVRAPYAAEIDGRWVIGDLRFDREKALGMAEMVVDGSAHSPCRHKAPWVPPRASLLGEHR